MISIITIILSTFILFFIISTKTLWFCPKVRKNILESNYSSNEDIWVKKEGNKKVLIFFHGMYSSPENFREFANYTVKEGWDVYLPVLPNSSNSNTELIAQGAYQWEESLQVAYHKAIVHNKDYEAIFLGGHSQGGAIALSIAPSLTFLKALIIVAAPMRLTHGKYSLSKNLGMVLSGFLSFFLPNKGVVMKNRNADKQALVENHPPHYESFYHGLTLHSMNLGLKRTRKSLQSIKTPVFLAYEKGDRLVDFKDSTFVKNSVSSPIVKETVFDTPLALEPYSKRHALFSYIHTKDRLFEEIIDFLKSQD